MPIHANIVKFVQGISGRISNASYPGKTKLAVVGQSPQSFNLTERFSVQGLDFERGIFQFVSPRTQRGHVSRRDTPIISQITAALKSCAEVPTRSLVLADRFEVISFDKIDLEDSGDDSTSYRLMARDRQNNGAVKTMIVTQAGLEFGDRLLRSEQITRASKLMDLHCDKSAPLEQHTQGCQEDPITVSFAGIGRSATVSVFREIKARFDAGLDERGLDNAIEDCIAAGRRDRGPRFVHSEEQKIELKKALLKELQGRETIPITQRNSPRAADLRRQVQFDADTPMIGPCAPALVPTLDAPLEPFSANAVARQPPSTQEMLAFVEEHVRDSPLQFFEAVARKDPLLAAFCSVQARRMLTPNSCPDDRDAPVQSMHLMRAKWGRVHDRSYDDGILAKRKFETDNVLDDLQPVQGFKEALFVQLTEDLNSVLSSQQLDPVDTPRDATHQFPNGYRAALEMNRFAPQPREREVPEKLSERELSRFLQQPFSSSLDLIEDLAPHNPHAATFLNMVEHALLINDSRQQTAVSSQSF